MGKLACAAGLRAWAGIRLSTEAEREFAARGGLANQSYLWGNSIDANKANYNGNVGDTTTVSVYPTNNYGLYDMAGNVREWCLDESESDFHRNSPHWNPIAGEPVSKT